MQVLFEFLKVSLSLQSVESFSHHRIQLNQSTREKIVAIFKIARAELIELR